MSEMTIAERETKPADLAAAPPAYFLSLTIANVRCFGQATTLDLSDSKGRPAQWTVLLGENGIGKTTVLQCLAAMQPRLHDPTLDVNYDENKKYAARYTPRLSSGLNQDVSFLFEKATSRSAPDPPMLDIRAGVVTGSLINADSPREKKQTLEVSGNRHFQRAKLNTADVSGLNIFGYGASRRSGKTTLSDPRKRDSCASLIDDSELMNAEEWLQQADYATRINARLRQKRAAKGQLTRVKTLLIGLLPGVSDFRFVTAGIEQMTPRVEALTPYGWVRVSELSLGYKTALTWLIDFASGLFECYPNSDNPFAEPAVCLIDEIDLHLHPRWQRDLVKHLTDTFPNTQFIVTAHSPLIVQAAPDANLALLRREGDHVVIDNDVDEIRNWRVDQILTSDLFGLDTARPPRLASALSERRRIMSQPVVSEFDRQRLAELNAEIGDQTSLGENPLEMQALDALRRAAALLERDEKNQAPGK